MRGAMQTLRRGFPILRKPPTVRAMAMTELDTDSSMAASRRPILSYCMTALRGQHCDTSQAAEPMFDGHPRYDALASAAVSKDSLFDSEELNIHSETLLDATSVADVKASLDQAQVPEKMCPCGGGFCKVFTATTEANAGRQFYRCPLKGEGRCGFFQWCDGITSASQGLPKEDGRSLGPLCPCGGGPCNKRTARTEKNMGRQFYRCPLSQESQCSFFKWCDEIPSSSNSDVNLCYKCGLNDHRTKDCPLDERVGISKEASVNTSGGYDKWERDAKNYLLDDDQLMSSYFGGVEERPNMKTCYTCGQAGHWAKDCPTRQCCNNGKGSLNSSGYDSPKFDRGKGMAVGICFTCGSPGHWAKDCPDKGQSRYTQPQTKLGASDSLF